MLTTGQNDPLLTGALCSICISAIVCTAVRILPSLPARRAASTAACSHKPAWHDELSNS